MATTRKVVGDQIEVTTISTLTKNETLARITALDENIADLSAQISELQKRIDELILLRDELQSLTNQILTVG